MLEKCTLISAVCEVGAPDAQLQAYKKIIDLADVVLAVYDRDTPAIGSTEERALIFADKLRKPLLVIPSVRLETGQFEQGD